MNATFSLALAIGLLGVPPAPSATPAQYDVVFTTTAGTVVVEVTRAWAPAAADRFYHLVEGGYFTGAPVVPGKDLRSLSLGRNKNAADSTGGSPLPGEPNTQGALYGAISFASSSPGAGEVLQFDFPERAYQPVAGAGTPFGVLTQGIEYFGDLMHGTDANSDPVTNRVLSARIAPAASTWVDAVLHLRYVSGSGDDVSLSGPLAEFRQEQASGNPQTYDKFRIAHYRPGVTWGRSSGLVRLCLDPGWNGIFTCMVSAVIRASDSGDPPYGVAGAVTDATIGLPLAKLLAQLGGTVQHKIAGKGGSIVYVTSSHEAFVHGDHGMSTGTEDRYLLRDGIVVAHVVHYFED